MRNILKKLFARSTQKEVVEFTKIIREGEQLAVCASEDIFINYQLVSRLCSWSNKKIEIFFNESEVQFWKKVLLPENIKIKDISELSNVDKSFIINFSDDKETNNILVEKTNCVISDIDNRYNLIFEPFFDDEISLLMKLEDFFPECEFSFSILKMLDISVEPSNAFILDIANTVPNKKCLILIDNLKKVFDPDILLIGPEFNTAELVSLKKIPMSNIAEKYRVAFSGKIFITDNAKTALLFDKFGIKLIYIGKEKLENIITIDPLDNFEMKNSIADLLKRRTDA